MTTFKHWYCRRVQRIICNSRRPKRTTLRLWPPLWLLIRIPHCTIARNRTENPSLSVLPLRRQGLSAIERQQQSIGVLSASTGMQWHSLRAPTLLHSYARVPVVWGSRAREVTRPSRSQGSLLDISQSR